MRTDLFKDRTAAGTELASRLAGMGLVDPVVLALPRGGIPVALPIARKLNAPLDLLLVRKIGVPWQPELAAAAVVDGERPDLVLNEEVVALASISEEKIAELAKHELREIDRRRRVYLRDRAPERVAGRTAIVVDDGIATGTTVKAALVALRRRSPARLLLAVPVAPAETLLILEELVDDVVCLATPDPFCALSLHYQEFHQLSDAEVADLLMSYRRNAPPAD